MSWNEEEVKTKLKNEGISENEVVHLIRQRKRNIIDNEKSKKVKNILDTLKESEE